MIKKEIKNKIIFLMIAGAFFILTMENVHLFDWDEINFAEAAREMIVTGDYLNVRIDYQPFHEKPPLYIWIEVVSMKIFGINEFAARFPNAIIGIITLAFLMNVGKKVFSDKFGFLWALAYFGSFLPYFYFKTNIIDPVFNLLMYAGVYYLYLFTIDKINDIISDKYIYIASIFTALAFLTKGPVGFMLVFITWAVFWGFNSKQFRIPVKQIFIFTFLSFLPALIWYFTIFMQQGGGLISEFITYQIRLLTTGDAGHDGPFYYHFIVVFLGCFPASVFVFQAFKKNISDNSSQVVFKNFNIILLIVVLVIFSIVKTKIIHYSSLSYFPVTFLAAYILDKIISGKTILAKYSKILILVVGIIFSSLFVAFPLVLMNINYFLPMITDKLTHALLQSEVNWSGFEIIVGLIILAGLISFVVLFRRSSFLNAIYSLFGSIALAMFVFLPMMAPKIEIYTQNAPVEFFKELAGKDVYVHTLGYKSYAPYFYQQNKLMNSKYGLKLTGSEYEEYLLNGKISKPAYFSTKINNFEKYLEIQPALLELYRKNGYVFFVRTN